MATASSTVLSEAQKKAYAAIAQRKAAMLATSGNTAGTSTTTTTTTSTPTTAEMPKMDFIRARQNLTAAENERISRVERERNGLVYDAMRLPARAALGAANFAAELTAEATALPTHLAAALFDMAGANGISKSLQESSFGLEGQRQALGVNASEELLRSEALKGSTPVTEVALRGAEMAGAGLVTGVPMLGYAKSLASSLQSVEKGKALQVVLDNMVRNPEAFLKAQGAVDFAAGSFGEVAAKFAESADAEDPEMARSFTMLATGVGAGTALSLTRRLGRSLKDVGLRVRGSTDTKRAIARTLAQTAEEDPNLVAKAHENMEAFREMGLKEVPPAGNLSGDPELVQFQKAALSDTPNAAQAEASRQARSSMEIRAKAREILGVDDAATVAGAETSASRAALKLAQTEQTAAERAVSKARSTVENTEARQAFIDERLDEVKTIARRLADESAENATVAREQALADLRPGISATEAGRSIVARLEAARSEFQSRAREAYSAFFDKVGDQTAEGSILTEAVRSAVESTGPTADKIKMGMIPSSIKRAFGRVAGKDPDDASAVIDWVAPSEISLRELNELRSLLLAERRSVGQGGIPNDQVVRIYDTIIKGIDDTFEAAGETAAVGLREINSWYRAGKRQFFRGQLTDLGRDVSKKGGLEVPPSEVARRFLKSDKQGGRDAMEEFRATFAGLDGRRIVGSDLEIPAILADETALKALDDFVLGEVNRLVTRTPDGKLNIRSLRRFVADHSEALELRPELRDTLKNQKSAQDAIDAAEIALRSDIEQRRADLEAAYRGERQATRAQIKTETRELQIAEDRLNQIEREFQRGRIGEIIEDPRGVAAKMARSDDLRPIRENLAAVGDDKAAKAGLGRLFWDELDKATNGDVTDILTGETLLDPKRFSAVVEKNERKLIEFFGFSHVHKLKELARLARLSLGVKPPTPNLDAPNTSSAVRGLTMLGSRLWGVARRQVSPTFAALERATSFLGSKAGRINDNQARNVLLQAIYDPRVMDDLLAWGRDPGSDKAINKVLTWVPDVSRAARAVNTATSSRKRRDSKRPQFFDGQRISRSEIRGSGVAQ